MRTHLRKMEIPDRGTILAFDKGLGPDLRNELQAVIMLNPNCFSPVFAVASPMNLSSRTEIPEVRRDMVTPTVEQFRQQQERGHQVN